MSKTEMYSYVQLMCKICVKKYNILNCVPDFWYGGFEFS